MLDADDARAKADEMLRSMRYPLDTVVTCVPCPINDLDPYNTDGDCLAEK